MQNITFDSIPSLIGDILRKVNNIEETLNSFPITTHREPDRDRWLSIDELIDYLPGQPSKGTIYGKIHKRLIPHKKFGSKLIFLKSEIDIYLQSLHQKTVSEIENEAELFITKQMKK